MCVCVCVHIYSWLPGFLPWGTGGLVRFSRALQCEALRVFLVHIPGGASFFPSSFPSCAGGTGVWVSLRTGVLEMGSLMLAVLKLREMVWFQVWLCFSERRKLISLSFISIGLFY